MWSAIVIFERLVSVWCRIHEQINTAYPTNMVNLMAAFVMKMVGRGWILSGISLKSENFLRTVPRLQTVDLHPLWAHLFTLGSCSENLWNQAKCTALFTKLSCAMQTEEPLFSRAMPILKCTNRNFEPSLQILPCLEWNDACLFV